MPYLTRTPPDTVHGPRQAMPGCWDEIVSRIGTGVSE
jgi:hypothetical protein